MLVIPAISGHVCLFVTLPLILCAFVQSGKIYYINIDLYSVHLYLTDCLENCEVCVNDTYCFVCKTGYCYDEAEKKCHAKGGSDCALCEKREGDVSCLTCYDGTYLELCQGIYIHWFSVSRKCLQFDEFSILFTTFNITSLQHVTTVYV